VATAATAKSAVAATVKSKMLDQILGAAAATTAKNQKQAMSAVQSD